MNDNDLPTLYYYQHCPYCVRVLAFAGMADIKLQHQILLNDDEVTPISMIGRKMVPILALANGQFLIESLDIIDYLSQTYHYPLEKEPELVLSVNTLIATNRMTIYGLTMPRWIREPYGEFVTSAAIDYFTKKKEQTIGDFDLALSNTTLFSQALADSLANSEMLFIKLISHLESDAAIILFSALYGVLLVEDFPWTSSSKQFMTTMLARTKFVQYDYQSLQ